MDLGLDGKVAVVTGASKGIGLAIGQGRVVEGARVVAGARSTSAEIEELVAAGPMLFQPVNLSTVDAPATLARAAEVSGLDILVNNVGAVTIRNGFLTITDEDWLSALNLSFMAARGANRLLGAKFLPRIWATRVARSRAAKQVASLCRCAFQQLNSRVRACESS